MSALTVALITQLAASPACSVPGMVPAFWEAVVSQESAHDPLALHDDTTNMSFHPASTDTAVSLATLLMQAGHSVGVGLSQLTAKSEQQFQQKFGLTIRQALDPCTNMKAGALHYVAGALSTYNSGSPTRAPAYAKSVLTAVGVQQTVPAPPAPSTPQPLPGHSHMRDLLHPDPSDDQSGPGRSHMRDLLHPDADPPQNPPQSKDQHP